MYNDYIVLAYCIIILRAKINIYSALRCTASSKQFVANNLDCCGYIYVFSAVATTFVYRHKPSSHYKVKIRWKYVPTCMFYPIATQ